MKKSILGAVLAVLATGCGVGQGTVTDQGEDVTVSGTGLTWEQFKNTKVFVEPDTGVLIADGDTPFFSMKQLREFYELNVRDGQLIVNRIGTADDKWNDTQKLNLTYCVSDGFGGNKSKMVTAMNQATAAWAAVANIKFVYVPAQDGNCTASNTAVLFDVRPIAANGSYLARAFFPAETRRNRELVVDSSSFASDVSLAGILRHELGHVLGFRHEHTRPQAGTCFEDNEWRALTQYDAASVMHYPQCNGSGNWMQLNLTALDAQGAAALYGAPNTGTTPPPAPTTGSGTETFTGSVAANENKAYGPFTVVPGSTFKAVLSGSGDADLYVRFGAAPTASTWACRPYLDSSNEECTLTVPTTATTVYLTVSGFSASNFSLALTYAKGSTQPAPTGTPSVANASASIAKGQLIQYDPINVLAGTQLKVTMTGSGDPDLYVRFAGQPSLTLFDCRPYVGGASETCTVTVPAGATKFYMAVNGYTAGSFSLVANYVAP